MEGRTAREQRFSALSPRAAATASENEGAPGDAGGGPQPLPVFEDSASDSGPERRPSLLTWGDAVRAQDAAGIRAPDAFWRLCNTLSNADPGNFHVEILSAEVLPSGRLLLYLELVIGPPPRAGEEAAGDSRQRFRFQVDVVRNIIRELGPAVFDAWGAARS